PRKQRVARQMERMNRCLAWIIEPASGCGAIEDCLANEFRTDAKFRRLLTQGKKVEAARHYQSQAGERELSEVVDERSNIQDKIPELYQKIRSWAGETV